ncbi:MAG: SMC-Scp complex subunit ScpB [Leptospiraceae bacterium]|nr:SMC-Scp complex subunit ScpB [Leptospiraceae bacterium]MCB1200454.1 SMC-Scp complex subunit ScpB [Leptospiraceae bacterium]
MENPQDTRQLTSLIEALLLISGGGMSVNEIANGLGFEASDVKIALDSLVDDFLERDGGIIISESGGRYRFATRPEVFPMIRNYLKEKKRDTLSRSVLETLAIIAYRQPITLFEIDEIRGVNSRSLVTSLISRKLVKPIGQKEAPGRPTLYGTTREFLEYFGLNGLEELPPPAEVKELNFEEL